MGRVSRVRDIEKKVLRLRSKREKDALAPPYDCVMCEGFGCVQVTVRRATYIFRCMECSKFEIVPQGEGLQLIDQYNLISDKWLAERRNKPVPDELEFDIVVDRREDRREILELSKVTYGRVQLFTRVGGEILPIEIEEAIKLPKEAPDRSVVDWTKVITEIVESGQYYSAKEVKEKFAHDEVKTFRTKSVLDKAVEKGVLAKFWHKRMYIYGRPIE